MAEITLNQNVNNRDRLDYLFTLLNNAEKREDFLHERRDKNFQFALIIFAVVSGFSQQLAVTIKTYSIFGFLVVVMISALMYEIHLHRFACAWRKTYRNHRKTISKTLNTPGAPITFKTFEYQALDEALTLKSWFSMRRIVYYLLILLSVFIMLMDLL